MAGKKRTDNKGRILRNGEMQRAEDNRYLYRYTDLSGRKRTVYAVTLVELREKEKQIERDLQDGIDSSLSIRIWVTADFFFFCQSFFSPP